MPSDWRLKQDTDCPCGYVGALGKLTYSAFEVSQHPPPLADLLQILIRVRGPPRSGATRAFATGRTGEAINAYGDKGMVHSAETREDARAELVEGWNDARRSDPAKSRIILTHTNDEVRDLNIAARDKLRDHGELGRDVDVKTERGERQFASGDRMMFRRNERGMGVKNGTLGTVESVTPGHMAVRTDDGRSVAFDLKDYAHVDHGYAATFHKSQGVTVDQAHVLATPGMDRHSAYVGLTRHRDGVQLHYGRDDFADQSKLVRTLSRERTKDMASDHPLPDAAARGFAERREFRFGDMARDMVAKARGLFADPDRIAALRGRLDKALGREPSAPPEADKTKNKEPEQERGTNAAALRLHARMAELGKQVRKDDERDRDRTKDRAKDNDRDRGGPGR